MPRGCLWEILVAGLIISLLILFYLHYLEPRIKGTVQILKEVEEISGERKIKARKPIKKEMKRETTGIEEVDEYRHLLEDAQEKLRKLRKAIRPR